MPEMPSPMGLSFLEYFMDALHSLPLSAVGLPDSEGLSSVRVLHGRPYLNATLFYSLVGQLGGDPSLNAEQMGGVQLLTAAGCQPHRTGGIRASRLVDVVRDEAL